MDAVLVSFGIGSDGGLRSARTEGDDVGRALWPLDGRYEVVVVVLRRRPGPRGTSTGAMGGTGCRRGLAHNRGEGFEGVNRVYWLSGVRID